MARGWPCSKLPTTQLCSMATAGGLPRLRGIAHDAHVPSASFYPPGQLGRIDAAGLPLLSRSLSGSSRSGTAACQKRACPRPSHTGAWPHCAASSRRNRPASRDAWASLPRPIVWLERARRTAQSPWRWRFLALSNPTGSLLIVRPFSAQDAAAELKKSEAAGAEHRDLGHLQLFERLGAEVKLFGERPF